MWSTILGLVALTSDAYATKCGCELAQPAEVARLSCAEARLVSLTPPAMIKNTCGKVTVTGVVVVSNGVPTWLPLVKGAAVLPIGEHVVRWTATDKAGKVLDTADGVVVVEPAIAALSSMTFNDRAMTDAVLASYGTTELGVDALSGTILSEDAVWLRNRATVDGDVWTGAWLDLQQDAVVLGDVYEDADVPLPWLVMGVDGPPAGATSIVVNSGTSLVLPPGSYGQVIVNSNATLVLQAGEYGMTDLVVNSGAVLDATSTELFLTGGFTFRGVQRGMLLHVQLSGFGTAAIETDFAGFVTAPYGSISLASGGHDFTGWFRGDTLMVGEDGYLVCDLGCAD